MTNVVESKYVLESGAPLFIREVVQSIREGWYVDPTRNDVEYHRNGGIELKMFKMDTVFDTIKGGTYKITTHSPVDFLVELQGYILNGFDIELDGLIWDNDSAKIMKVSRLEYTAKDLENMEWEAFKDLCRTKDIGGRNRNTMVNASMRQQEAV